MTQNPQITSKFSVRGAEPADAEAIGVIHTKSWKTTYKGIVHQSFLDSIDLNHRILRAADRIKNLDINCLVLIETASNKVMGFADVGPCREKNVDSDGELYAIYLLQEFQNQGGGKALFSACVATAKAQGYSRLMVSILEKNIPSCKFYENMGGKYIGADHVDIEQHRYPTSTYIWEVVVHWKFGNTKELADGLAERVRLGNKTATTGLAKWTTSTNFPPLNENSCITNFDGRSICVVKVIRIEKMKFLEVPETHAAKEGSINPTFENWRKSHMAYFKSIDANFSENDEVVCVEFVVVKVY